MLRATQGAGMSMIGNSGSKINGGAEDPVVSLEDLAVMQSSVHLQKTFF